MNKKINFKVSCLGSVYYGSNLHEVELSIKSLTQGIEKPDEIILVIDGDIKKNLKSYLKNLEKSNIINLVTCKDNNGLGVALNIGLKECKYELICRFDTDDISLSNRLIESKKAFERNPNLDIFGSQIIEFIDSKNKFVRCNFKKMPLSNLAIKNALNFRNSINHPTVVFKKKTILEIGGYENISFFEDYHLWLKARKNNCIFLNSSIPLVLMKRESVTKRRQGFIYAKNELNFYLISIGKGLIKLITFFIFPLRVFSRILPSRISFLYYLIPWRNNYSSCLNPKYLEEFSIESLKIISKKFKY